MFEIIYYFLRFFEEIFSFQIDFWIDFGIVEDSFVFL